MTDEQPPTADVIKPPLFTRATQAPHLFPPAWEHKRVPKTETYSGSEQIERECKACGLVRVTLMRGAGERHYRWGDARYQFEEQVEPECVPVNEIRKEAAE